MDELASIVAENLVALRKGRHLTQQELADSLGYSDKLISKWELGKAVPTVDKLMQLSSFYKVSLDALVTKNGCKQVASNKLNDKNMTNKVTIMAMAGTFILFVAVAVFVNSLITEAQANAWIAFIYMIPAIGLVESILDFRFYGKNVALWILLSVAIWGILLAVAMHFYYYFDQNIFYILLVGIPLQIAMILFSQFK